MLFMLICSIGLNIVLVCEALRIRRERNCDITRTDTLNMMLWKELAEHEATK